MKRVRSIAIVLVTLGVVIGAGAAHAGAPAASKAASRQQTIRIDNFSFNAKTLEIRVGTEVTWVNHDDVPHKIVSTNKAFTSPVLDTDGRYSFTFTKPGTYEYFCSIHPMMTGTIVVK